MKFKNPTEVTVRVASTSGMVAIFAPGEEKEVPEALDQACIEERLTEVKAPGEEKEAPKVKAPGEEKEAPKVKAPGEEKEAPEVKATTRSKK